MSEILNENFASVFTVEKDMEARELGEINNNILKSGNIAEEVGLDVLKRIKVDKSSVYPRTLWEAREVIVGLLAEMFVSSIATGVMVSKFEADTKTGGVANSKS
eukprot:g31010.t1